MTTQFFGRKVRVEVGRPGETGTAWEGLRIAFKVEKTGASEPDKAEVQLYNLSRSSRSAAEADGLVVRLFGGYVTPALLFSGDVSKVEHESALPDIATRIEAEDGGRAWASRMQETFAGPVDAATLIRRLADVMRIPVAYLDPDIAAVQFQTAYVVSGPVRRSLDDLTATVGASWMVQDGALVVYRTGQPVTRTGPVLTPTTGLVGRAEKTDDGVKVTALLQPSLVPGAVFRVESEGATGWFRATKVTHVGDSGWDTPFYTEVEAREVAV